MNKKKLIIVGIILVLLVFFGGYKFMTKSKKVKINPNVEINVSDLDINFLKLENNKENIIYSPLSIKYALSMLKEGADGNTLKEISNVLNNDNLPTYKNINKVLSFANGLFIRDTFRNNVKKEYVGTLKDNYNAEVKYDKFKSASNINDWIEEKTFKIIKKVVNDSSFKNDSLKMLLINALAIDMKWQEEFSYSDTGPDNFYGEDGKMLEVTMMNLQTDSEGVKYYQDDGIKCISLPLKQYDDVNLDFIAIMPKDNLSNYIGDLTIDRFNELISKLHEIERNKKIYLSIPKFAYKYSLDFLNDLEKLGVKEVFTYDANLSKISTEAMYVGDALHKADIKFSEEGIKAAAVTVFGMYTSGMYIEEKEIIDLKFNKPFIYIIKDRDNDTIWFIGSLYKPNLWKNDKHEYRN